jgi:hypothetical protein
MRNNQCTCLSKEHFSPECRGNWPSIDPLKINIHEKRDKFKLLRDGQIDLIQIRYSQSVENDSSYSTAPSAPDLYSLPARAGSKLLDYVIEIGKDMKLETIYG